MKEKILTMKLLEEKYGVARLDSAAPVPAWANEGAFTSITRTSDELSVVCPESNVPLDIKCERDWKTLKILGPLDFALVGILAPISGVLAEKKISIFAISTYDTDYILIKEKDVGDATDALEKEGYEII